MDIDAEILTRREALCLGGAALAAGAALPRTLWAAEAADKAAAPEARRPRGSDNRLPTVAKPLPFNPAKVAGLSEKLLLAHHANHYVAAVAGLNAVRDGLAAVHGDTPAYVVAGLKETELRTTNAITLHELYFTNIAGSGKPGGDAQNYLARTFGSFARFEALFLATARSLEEVGGWTVLLYNFHRGELDIVRAAGHAQALATGIPLLVLDMDAHAYEADFGAAAGRYVDAFWQSLHWDEVNRRLERAIRAVAALR